MKQADSFAALPKTMHFRVWKMSITSRVAILFLLLVILPMAGTAWMIEEGWLLQDLAKRKSPRPEWLIALSDTLRKMNEKRRPGLSWLIDLASIFMELGKNKDLKAVLARSKLDDPRVPAGLRYRCAVLWPNLLQPESAPIRQAGSENPLRVSAAFSYLPGMGGEKYAVRPPSSKRDSSSMTMDRLSHQTDAKGCTHLIDRALEILLFWLSLFPPASMTIRVSPRLA
ncbi:MAG: hypothetical protein ACOC23_06910 [Thermodesulfobacteriota bacterium]